MNYWEQIKQTANTRMTICRTCEHFEEGLAKCKLCGCFMKAKTMLSNARCPLNKWELTNEASQEVAESDKKNDTN